MWVQWQKLCSGARGAKWPLKFATGRATRGCFLGLFKIEMGFHRVLKKYIPNKCSPWETGKVINYSTIIKINVYWCHIDAITEKLSIQEWPPKRTCLFWRKCHTNKSSDSILQVDFWNLKSPRQFSLTKMSKSQIYSVFSTLKKTCTGHIYILNRIYYVAAAQSYDVSCEEERQARPVGNGLHQSLQALTVQ